MLPVQQQDNGAAAVEEFSLFLAARHRAGAVVIVDFSHQHGADLHLHDRAEVLGFDHGIFPTVFGENRSGRQRDRTHRVQATADKHVLPLDAGHGIAVPVVVVHAQAEHQTDPVAVLCRQRFVLQQRRDGVDALLDRQDGILPNTVGTEQAVTRGDQDRFVIGKRPQTAFDPPAEAIVEATKMIGFKLRKVDAVAPYKAADQRLGQSAVQKRTAQARNPTGSQQL